jgi:hypothetical protein
LALRQLGRSQRAPERMRRIGVLMSLAESDPEALARVAAFRTGLQTLGWAESRNLRIDIRWAASDAALMQQSAFHRFRIRGGTP